MNDVLKIGIMWRLITIIAICTLCFITGTFFNNEIYVTRIIYFERPLYKIDNFQNYSNDEVRTAINYSVKYLNNPSLLMELDYPAWIQWTDYESRVVNANYNYWIISYAFNL